MTPSAKPTSEGLTALAAQDTLPSLERVYAQARHENFPVASRVLPSRHRRHLLALYAFARMVDDIGDDGPTGSAPDSETPPTPASQRLRRLDEVSQNLDGVFSSTPPAEPVYRDLAMTVRECGLSREPFERLVEANRRDQVVHRCRTFDDLLRYCTLSAEPVGRLVLGVFGVDTAHRRVLSDRICSALQVLEHCQDVAEDARAGRIYLPTEDMERFGVTEHDLLARRADTPVRALVGFQTQRAVRLLDEGAPLVDSLSGSARLAVAGYVAGGRATAHALASAGFDVLTATPRPTRARTLLEFGRLLAAGGAR
ncbi:squalene synthase HpnC [Saccharomonospora amisosensis]|uniref:Squalene synthase HpnC n=1 Tax=Saccharomonospora amisosensis TaxID=1128677 RepID=A0A7X5ZRH4_9PSEU|nr:squalene synthase HpnC [Saccharomonospora amisosensis]NIJ12355.1 squalene synthase HpnC [Saccharomonospora amisosensis]